MGAWENAEFIDIHFRNFTFPSTVSATSFTLCTFDTARFIEFVSHTTFEGCVGIVKFEQGAEQLLLLDFNGNLFAAFPRLEPGIWVDVASGLFVEG